MFVNLESYANERRKDAFLSTSQTKITSLSFRHYFARLH